MKWEADEDNPEIQLLVGRDQDNEPIELGRVEPGTHGFWRWSGAFVMGCGGCQSQSGAMRQSACGRVRGHSGHASVQPRGRGGVMVSRRQTILAAVDDLVGELLYYGRKEDQDLPRGEIEAAIRAGELTVEDIVEAFATPLRRSLGSLR